MAAKLDWDYSDVFPPSKDLGPRDWGSEVLLGVSPGQYTFKLLTLRAGRQGGLQYHRLKDECGFIVEGELLVRVSFDGKTIHEFRLGAGSHFRFPPGLIHQEEAITDCVILEASTPYLNDRVRVEPDFGMEINGLPTTSFEDITSL